MAKSVKYLLKIRQASIYLYMCQICHLHGYLSKDFQTVSIVGIILTNTEACKSKWRLACILWDLCLSLLRIIVLSGENWKSETKSANLTNFTIVVTSSDDLLLKNTQNILLSSIRWHKFYRIGNTDIFLFPILHIWLILILPSISI